MAAAYLLGLVFVLACVQGGVIQDQHAVIEDLREVEPSWRSSRIVSGWPAEEGQFPFQISLRMVSGAGAVSSCGGSLIHHNWVITAAHCVANRISFVIRLGVIDLSRPTHLVESTNKFIHPDYNEIQAGVQTADLALIGFDTYIPYSDLVQPIRLQSSAQKNIDYAGKTLIVSGFGRTNDLWLGGAASEELLWVYQLGVSIEECRSFYPNSVVIQEQTICANYYNVSSPAQSSCQGDSGGPLTIVDEDGQRTMVGIVSFGHVSGCSAPVPSGYVRPGHYQDWFTEVTGLDFDWTFPSEEEDSASEEKEEEADSDEDSESEEDEEADSDEDDSESEEEEAYSKVIVVDM